MSDILAPMKQIFITNKLKFIFIIIFFNSELFI